MALNTPGKHSWPPWGSFAGLRSDERRTASAVVVPLLVALMGFGAIAVDMGWRSVLRDELQRAAHSGALAGVVDLVYNGEDAAQATAVAYATHPVHFLFTSLTSTLPAAEAVDVTVLGPETLRVRVRRTEGMAGAVAAFLVRLWGMEAAESKAVAVATLNRQTIEAGPDTLSPVGIYEAPVSAGHNGGPTEGIAPPRRPWTGVRSIPTGSLSSPKPNGR